MYAHIRGQLIYSSPAYAIVESNGVGFKILTPVSLYTNLGSLGQEVFLFTSFVVRELSQTLFGFKTASERDLFELLLNVSGIGPKTALSLVGHLPFIDLVSAIRNSDDKTLSQVPGIGKKTAERLVLEVKDKIKEFVPSFQDQYTLNISPMGTSQVSYDALSALVNLGYKEAVAQKTIQKILGSLENEPELSDLISLSLKAL